MLYLTILIYCNNILYYIIILFTILLRTEGKRILLRTEIILYNFFIRVVIKQCAISISYLLLNLLLNRLR